MDVLHRGFDGLDIAFQTQISEELSEVLNQAKSEASEAMQPVLAQYNGQRFLVAETGAKGGYAYRCDTGPEGAVWFFKRPKQNADNWGIRASVRSLPLALYGLDGVRIRLHEFLKNLGVDCGFDEVSIGRVDFAIDVLAPGFFLEPENFVMHARNNRTDRADTVPYAQSGHSGNFTSVTIGKMPGRQVIVYDKRAEVIAKHKPEWWEIWNAERRRQGQPDLDSEDREASNIWRVEIRAGKKHLKDNWDVTHWSSLYDRLPHIMRKAVQEIRYCSPTSDTNRSRWPDDILWQVVKSETAQISNFPNPDIPIPAIRELILADLADMLIAQIIGNTATLSVVHQLPLEKAHRIVGLVGRSISKFIQSEPGEFKAKRQRAEAKYFLS